MINVAIVTMFLSVMFQLGKSDSPTGMNPGVFCKMTSMVLKKPLKHPEILSDIVWQSFICMAFSSYFHHFPQVKVQVVR
jgi:hypothetical protein